MIDIKLSTDACCVCEEHISRKFGPAIKAGHGVKRRVHTAWGVKTRVFFQVRDEEDTEWLADSVTGTLFGADGKSSDPQLYLIHR